MQVPDHSIQIKALEFLGIVKLFTHRVGNAGLFMKHVNVQPVRPPFAVYTPTLATGKRAFACAVTFGVYIHLSLLFNSVE
jgi:hypothetical protein